LISREEKFVRGDVRLFREKVCFEGEVGRDCKLYVRSAKGEEGRSRRSASKDPIDFKKEKCRGRKKKKKKGKRVKRGKTASSAQWKRKEVESPVRSTGHPLLKDSQQRKPRKRACQKKRKRGKNGTLDKPKPSCTANQKGE